MATRDNAYDPTGKLIPRLLSDDTRLNWLRLIRTRNVGPVTFQRLVNHCNGAGNALEFLANRTPRGPNGPQMPITVQMVERELRAARKCGAKLVATGEPGYPPALAHLDAPPPLLYIKGNGQLATKKAVAIVGSRNGSAIGQKLTRMLASGLSKNGYAVVSGLARGIDTAAHAGALENATIAVIAGGIDNYYPPQNRELQIQIEQAGLVITENPPGFKPRARDFPRRNRIISGCTLGTIVVEANLRSGSLITARLASEQGREVMAAPGHPLDPRATGTLRLIMGGASMITNADDVIKLLAPMTDMEHRPPPMLFENDQTEPEYPQTDISSRVKLKRCWTPSVFMRLAPMTSYGRLAYPHGLSQLP